MLKTNHMAFIRITTNIILSFLLFQSCDSNAQLPPPQWNQYRGPYRNGTDVFEKDTIKQFKAMDEKLWEVQGYYGHATSPVLDDQHIYFGYGNQMYALDRFCGAEIWKISFQEDRKWSGRASTPILDGNFIYFGSRDNLFYALDKTNGKLAWQFKTKGVIASSPAIVNNSIFFQAFDGNLYALDKNTGKELWRYETQGGATSPIVAGKKLLIGSQRGALYCLDPDTGALHWKYQARGRIYGSPIYKDETVYFGDVQAYLYAIDFQKGNKLWDFESGSAIYESPTLFDNVVIFNSNAYGMYGIDRTSGERLWFNGGIGAGEPMVTNGVLFYGTFNKKFEYLNAVDPSNGHLLWQERLFGRVVGNPAPHKHLLYLVRSTGMVAAYLSNQYN